MAINWNDHIGSITGRKTFTGSFAIRTPLRWIAAFFIVVACALPSFGAEGKGFDWFWLFYEKEKRPPAESIVFRPFYLVYQAPWEPGGVFDASLPPIIFWRYRTEKGENLKSLFGFIQATTFWYNGMKRFDLGIFPFLFYGTSPDQSNRYLLIIPFGGTLKNKFGIPKITTALFPGFLLFIFFPPSAIVSWQTLGLLIVSFMPLFALFEDREYRGYSIAWPLFHWGRGDDRRELRIFPFYTHFEKKGWHERYNVLLLFNYERLFFREEEHRMFFFFPLFGRRWSTAGNMEAYTVLWPFFSWGHNDRTGERSYNLPWPLVQIGDTREPSITKRIFFPFYGYYRFGSGKTIFITPLYFRLKKTSAMLTSDYSFYALVFWYFKREYAADTGYPYGSRWRYLKFWPLFHAEWNDRGDRSFNTLSLLPFRDPEVYERMYQPFWSIVEYRRYADGDCRLGLLLRLVTCVRSGGRLTELHFFAHLFGYAERRGGRYLSLFWIPVRIGDAPVDAAATDGDAIREDYTVLPPNGYMPGVVRFSCAVF